MTGPYPAIITLTIIFAAIALILVILVPILRDGQTPFVEPHKGKHATSQPRQGKQPWHTAELPVLPAPPPQHFSDPGDGILPPVALVRPWSPPAAELYACCGCCATGSPCDPRDSHRTPCEGGCNDVNTDAGTLALYRGDYGVRPHAEAERLAEAYRP